ncbi:type II CAAX endopeptidase family protein [Actinomyces sp. MRS3W]|uniref:CPBP family intramembrane glutamic endopeptidase n=1 Tax=Actinomyces sp. MRS3W TaxID=2800796 RepID=UPI0028FDB041|nr:type II CAAX endopeptidase family protein [Actinomyces sp. MRS3W]MDU0349270.1 type II CAAX endopeptidase family protein [Actinomyces sp. MRS3W]
MTSRVAPFLKGAFIVGYVGLFPLHLSRLWVPAGARGEFSMGAYVVLFVLGVCAWRRELTAQVRWVAAHKRRSLIALIVGVLGAFVLETLGALVSGLLAAMIPGADAALRNDSNILTAITQFPAWTVIAVLAVMGPMVEELCFRQFLLSALARRSRPWLGVAVSSLLFGMLHMRSWAVSEWVGIIPHLCFGVVAGVLFLKTRNNVLLPTAVHVPNNLNALVPAVL